MYTKKQLKEMNLKGDFTLDVINGIDYISFTSGQSIAFPNNGNGLNKVYNYLVQLGYKPLEGKINDDEFDGICQASQLGYNPFECTILKA